MLADFSSLLFPDACINCNTILIKGEKHLCSICLVNLPKIANNHQDILKLEQRLWGKLKVQKSFAFLKYIKGGVTQKLLFNLKYEGNKTLGIQLGKWFANEIASEVAKQQIDYIIPVPIHIKRKRKRGFNQSDIIAEGMSQVLEIPFETGAILRTENGSSQTKKNRWNRWSGTEGIYSVNKIEIIKDKNILIVDDVITTGATFEAVGKSLLSAEPKTISIATVGLAI